MPSLTPAKSDLVNAMTVAEIFLLLVFIVWCGAITMSKGPLSSDYWRTVATKYQNENDALKTQLEHMSERNAKLSKAVAFWQDAFGMASPPTSSEELIAALRSTAGKAVLQDAGRDFPRCEQNNLLVYATLTEGQVSVELATESPRLRQWSTLAQTSVAPIHSTLNDWTAIDNFLNTISKFYADQAAKAKPCRFDYKLSYKTNDDYHDGREKFETSFYPARVVHSSTLPIN